MPQKLTVDEFLALFRRAPGVDRWMSSADAEEYLTLITYLSRDRQRRRATKEVSNMNEDRESLYPRTCEHD